MPLVISLDTETTGVDVYHGARPYLVTFCQLDSLENVWYEWDVDPLTRKVQVPPEDLEEVVELIHKADELVFQHAKFDITALGALLPANFEWPWSKVRDTLVAGHLLASNHPHDLTSMALEYLQVDITKYEEDMEVVVNKCRNLVRRRSSPFSQWRIARGVDDPKGALPELPSAKKKVWKYDCWLPRAVVKAVEQRPGLIEFVGEELLDRCREVTVEYANVDSATTVALYARQRQQIESRGLWEIYEERLRLIPVIYEMERHGVAVNRVRVQELKRQYVKESEAYARVCLNIAASYDYPLTLPKSGVNNSLKEFIFDRLELPPIYNGKSAGASLDKDSLLQYENTLPLRSKARKFVSSLIAKRKRDTAVQYIKDYERFGIASSRHSDYLILHPHINQTGTNTLRASSSNPNEQNISKKEVEKGDSRTLRYLFGPLPGREWWTIDAENIELRIPAYEAQEPDLIGLFERPTEPPYYGSNHLLNFHTVYPDVWEVELAAHGLERVGPVCKEKYASTWYQRCKNGGFAVQYGAVEREGGEGTADKAFGRPGSHAKLKQRFQLLEALNRKYVQHAEKYGYVETIPDRSICPERGYPLLCSRGNWGRIKPTVPLNYHVQSTAMWWMARAMVRCRALLCEWRAVDKFDGHIILQIHDELGFDFPAGKGARPWLTNLPRIRKIAAAMRQGGEDIGVPTPVSVHYHRDNWADGITIKV